MKILIADDHALVRKGLGLLLAELFSDVEIVEANDAQGAYQILHNQKNGIDIGLIDLYMHDMEQGKKLQELVEASPKTPLAILSMSEKVSDIQQAFANGAKGYILKNSPNDVLKAAVSLVLCGETYVPSHALSNVSGVDVSVNPNEQEQQAEHDLNSLTPRESDVLVLMTKGQTNKEIAASLSLKENSIKKLVSLILSKLNVSNRTQAVLKAERSEWLKKKLS